MDAVMEHRNEMNFDHAIHSHFAASICMSGGHMKKDITYKDVYDPFTSGKEAEKAFNQNTKEGRKKIDEFIKKLG